MHPDAWVRVRLGGGASKMSEQELRPAQQLARRRLSVITPTHLPVSKHRASIRSFTQRSIAQCWAREHEHARARAPYPGVQSPARTPNDAYGQYFVHRGTTLRFWHACQIICVSCGGPPSARVAVDATRIVPSPQPMARRCGAAGSADSACAWPPSPPSVQSTCRPEPC